MKNTNMNNINIKQTHYSLDYQTPCRQRGFTLIEIMIAITIGLLMIAGILQITLASKESARLQRNMSFVQENIRISMELITRDIRQAGFYTDDDSDARILTQPTPFIVATTTNGGGANNDEITVTYESNTDCLGRAVDPVDGNRFAENRYFIENERLMCDGNGVIPPGESDTYALAEGVESMQILYGENTDGEPLSANRYVQAEQADLDNVVSVRIAMRFHSRGGVRSVADNNLYASLDAAPSPPAAGDKRIRRQVTTTVSLRN